MEFDIHEAGHEGYRDLHSWVFIQGFLFQAFSMSGSEITWVI